MPEGPVDIGLKWANIPGSWVDFNFPLYLTGNHISSLTGYFFIEGTWDIYWRIARINWYNFNINCFYYADSHGMVWWTRKNDDLEGRSFRERRIRPFKLPMFCEWMKESYLILSHLLSAKSYISCISKWLNIKIFEWIFKN